MHIKTFALKAFTVYYYSQKETMYNVLTFTIYSSSPKNPDLFLVCFQSIFHCVSKYKK